MTAAIFNPSKSTRSVGRSIVRLGKCLLWLLHLLYVMVIGSSPYKWELTKYPSFGWSLSISNTTQTSKHRAEQLNFNYTLTSAVNINRNNSSEKSRNNCVVTRPKYLNQIFFKAAYTQKQSICVFLANKLKCFFLICFSHGHCWNR